jgi:hypothetical protein
LDVYLDGQFQQTVDANAIGVHNLGNQVLFSKNNLGADAFQANVGDSVAELLRGGWPEPEYARLWRRARAAAAAID